MENNCTMVAYTDALEEDEIELSLGLSIGGTLRKSKKSKPMDKELVRSIDINTDLRESDNIFSGSSLSPAEIVGVETDFRFDLQQTKREIHALRRQEARRKRGEKQMKKRKLEAHREMREEEEENGVVACKREKLEKTHDTIGYGYGTHETRKQSVNQNLELDSTIFSSTQPFSVVPMQYQYPPVQYVPFAFPYVMPCWMPGAGTVDSEKNVVHPAACRSFRPFQAHGINCGPNFSNECDSEQNNDKDGRDGKPIMTNDSPGCSSSAISENRSISLQGNSSSESGSDSSHSKSSKPQLNNASTGSDTQGYSEHSTSSHPMESGQGIDKETNYTEKVVSSRIVQSSNTKPKEEAASETQPDPINKPISTTGNPTLSPLKETEGEMGKPPKPQQNQDTPSLPQMPCVSATGNGPNGKTITGFLYRYTKTEVSIVCVCHGSSFSPAEFVQHAGGIDVSHPLRHITVVSSVFG